jgi:intradiol ring-cleaving dioxygenase-like protein
MNNGHDNSPFSRRDVLSFIGSVVAVGFVGCGSSPNPTSPSASSSSSSSASTGTSSATGGTSVSTGSTNALCTVTPSLTEGPYFVDERLNRSDIRSDPSTGIVRPGVALTMRMQLSQISSVVGCTPLVGALVDTWHCDALGVYSDIAAQNSRGQRFLRGYQISDANGQVQPTGFTRAAARSCCSRSVRRRAGTTDQCTSAFACSALHPRRSNDSPSACRAQGNDRRRRTLWA